ncbi:hypothetical protein ACTXM3_17585 [Glutamicibacter arilaitensis]
MSALTLLGWIVGIAVALVAASTAAVFVVAAIGAIKAERRRSNSKGKRQC